MALNDAFIKNSTKFSGKGAGDKHSDGGGLYLHVTSVGKYWRMSYRMNGKQKTLSLGVYATCLSARTRSYIMTRYPYFADRENLPAGL